MESGGVAWQSSVPREEPGGGDSAKAATADKQAHAAANTLAAPPAPSPPPPLAMPRTAASAASTPAFDINSFSLFPSLLSPSPYHHSPCHSIVTLSAAAPSLVAPSPLLSESPTLRPQPLHANQGNEHILQSPTLIVNVWQSNLAEELAKILQLVDDYPYIAMDTEFPGVVARPAGTFKTSPDYAYQTLKCNVDMLKIIQLGLCFCDADGNIHPGTCTWQFNFAFNLSSDTYAQDSIDLLSKSGIDFSAHEKNGISAAEFGEWLITSGIVLNEDVKWISFHSGFDFGYLLKLLTGAPLPSSEDDFFSLLQTFFPCVYDIKYLMESTSHLHGGLSKIAETLHVIRIGPQHQAGSDSLLTAATFFKLRETHFNSRTNPVWAESASTRNAVKRELRLSAVPLPPATSHSRAHRPLRYSVITNSDSLSNFDSKFMGMLFGLNNDFTEKWKKKAEKEKERRSRKEKAVASGQAVSSSDDEEEEDDEQEKTTSNVGSHFSSASSSSSTSGGSGSYPLTPQKSSAHSHSHSSYASPNSQHDYHSQHQHSHLASKSATKNHQAAHLHRSRYSHDYS